MGDSFLSPPASPKFKGSGRSSSLEYTYVAAADVNKATTYRESTRGAILFYFSSILEELSKIKESKTMP